MVTDEGREVRNAEVIEEERMEKNAPKLMLFGDNETNKRGEDKTVPHNFEDERVGVQSSKGDADNIGKVEQEQEIHKITSVKDNSKQLEDVGGGPLEIMEEGEGNKDVEGNNKQLEDVGGEPLEIMEETDGKMVV
jgi:hypothetical protein